MVAFCRGDLTFGLNRIAAMPLSAPGAFDHTIRQPSATLDNPTFASLGKFAEAGRARMGASSVKQAICSAVPADRFSGAVEGATLGTFYLEGYFTGIGGISGSFY
jgi:hypothetical protein